MEKGGLSFSDFVSALATGITAGEPQDTTDAPGWAEQLRRRSMSGALRGASVSSLCCF